MPLPNCCQETGETLPAPLSTRHRPLSSTSPRIPTGTPCLHARSQGAAAVQVARSNGARIGPPGDLRFRAGLLDHEIPGAALRRAKERDGPFDRPRNQTARAEVEAVFRLRKQRLPAGPSDRRKSAAAIQAHRCSLQSSANRRKRPRRRRAGGDRSPGCDRARGQLLPGMTDAAGDGPLPKSADKDELIVSSSHFEVGVTAALARADQGRVACALEMERAIHS